MNRCSRPPCCAANKTTPRSQKDRSQTPVQLSKCRDVCNQNRLKEAEKTITNKDAMIKMLQDQLKKIEQLYKKNMDETEEIRLKYCLAAEELKKFKNMYQQNEVKTEKLFKEKSLMDQGQQEKQFKALKDEFSKWRQQCEDLLNKKLPDKMECCADLKNNLAVAADLDNKLRNIEHLMKEQSTTLNNLVGKVSIPVTGTSNKHQEDCTTDTDGSCKNDQCTGTIEEISDSSSSSSDDDAPVMCQAGMQTCGDEKCEAQTQKSDSEVGRLKRELVQLERELATVKEASGDANNDKMDALQKENGRLKEKISFLKRTILETLSPRASDLDRSQDSAPIKIGMSSSFNSMSSLQHFQQIKRDLGELRTKMETMESRMPEIRRLDQDMRTMKDSNLLKFQDIQRMWESLRGENSKLSKELAEIRIKITAILKDFDINPPERQSSNTLESEITVDNLNNFKRLSGVSYSSSSKKVSSVVSNDADVESANLSPSQAQSVSPSQSMSPSQSQSNPASDGADMEQISIAEQSALTKQTKPPLQEAFKMLTAHYDDLQKERVDKEKQIKLLEDLIANYDGVDWDEELGNLQANLGQDTREDIRTLQYYIEKVIEENGKLKATINGLMDNLTQKMEKLSPQTAATTAPMKKNCRCSSSQNVPKSGTNPEKPASNILKPCQPECKNKGRCAKETIAPASHQPLRVGSLENYVYYLQKQLETTAIIETEVEELRKDIVEQHQSFQKLKG